MKHWKVKPVHGEISTDFVTRVITGIGTDELAQHFLDAMQQLLPASHCTIFALEASGRVSALSTASLHGVVATITAVEYYRNRFDTIDSNMILLSRKRIPARPQIWMSHQFAHDVAEPRYRELCYTKPGIRERMSLLLLNEQGLRVAISYYRNLSFDLFDAEDFEAIASCSPVLYQAVMAHIRKATRSVVNDRLHHKILTHLAHRERQVISYVLGGKTTREMAELLSLSETTVLTYRYRAFAKLGIRTQRELLTMLDRLPENLTIRRSTR